MFYFIGLYRSTIEERQPGGNGSWSPIDWMFEEYDVTDLAENLKVTLF